MVGGGPRGGGRRALRRWTDAARKVGAATRVVADGDPETRGLRAGPRGRAEHQVARRQTSSGKHARSPEQRVLKGEKCSCRQSDLGVGAEC